MTAPVKPSGSRPALRLAAALLALAPAPAARAASLSVEGGAIVLGRTRSSPIVIRVDEPPGEEVLPLRLAVNVGRFSEPTRLGPGRYRAVYEPPATRFPQVALVAVWRETGPAARIDFLRIPLFGMTRIPVSARPGAEVRARVGVDAFGPVVADRRRRAEVPIHVEPGVRQCEVAIREPGGANLTRRVPIEVPPYNRLTAALVPHAVVADGKSPVRLDVFYDLGGGNLPPDRIRVTPSAGSVTFERASRGLYTYRYLPPADAPSTRVTFALSVAGDPEARASAELELGLPPPARLVTTAPPDRLRAGSGASAPVKVLVLDAAGMGLPGMEVAASANGEPLAAPAYRGGGVYEFTYAAPAAYPPGGLVQFRASAAGSGKKVEADLSWQLDAAPLPRSVTPRLVPSPVPADGQTEARLILEVRDAAGKPLEHAHLVAVASHGVLGKLEERGNGIYEETYLAPSSVPDGEASLRVTDGAGGFEQSFPIPLRPSTRRLLLGLAGGYTRSTSGGSGPRAGAELWMPFSAGPARFGAGIAVSYGTASRTVRDLSGTLQSVTDATYVPVALKLGYEVLAGRRLSLTLGAGALASWAQFKSSLAGSGQQGLGFGWMGFADLGWALGPGQALLQISYGAAAVQTADYRIDPGGASAALGYRLGVF